jgi:uncharacterized membrane protein
VQNLSLNEEELLPIIKKHKRRAINLFSLFGFIVLTILFVYDQTSALITLSYIIPILVFGFIITIDFCEKIVLAILQNINNR